MWRSTLAASLLGALMLGVFAAVCLTFDMGPFAPPAEIQALAEPGLAAAIDRFNPGSR